MPSVQLAEARPNAPSVGLREVIDARGNTTIGTVLHGGQIPDDDRVIVGSEIIPHATVLVANHLTAAGFRVVMVPFSNGFDMVSVAAGIAAAQAVLAALFWRMRSGAGQRVEVSMLAAALAINQWDIVAESETVERSRPSPGIQLESYDWPPDHGFVCADGSCLIDFLGHEEGWSLFFAEIGRADLLGDPRFNTAALIRNNKRFLSGLLNPTLRTWTLARLEPIVRDHGGTILPALDLAQVAQHPQVRGLGVIAGEAGDSLPTIRIPFRCTDAFQADDLRPAPRLGEDDEWVS